MTIDEPRIVSSMSSMLGGVCEQTNPFTLGALSDKELGTIFCGRYIPNCHDKEQSSWLCIVRAGTYKHDIVSCL